MDIGNIYNLQDSLHALEEAGIDCKITVEKALELSQKVAETTREDCTACHEYDLRQTRTLLRKDITSLESKVLDNEATINKHVATIRAQEVEIAKLKARVAKQDSFNKYKMVYDSIRQRYVVEGKPLNAKFWHETLDKAGIE
jgi:tRNA splicing endonuclease